MVSVGRQNKTEIEGIMYVWGTAIYIVCTAAAARAINLGREERKLSEDPPSAPHSLRVQDVPVCPVQPCTEVAIVPERNELVAQAVTVPEREYISAQSRLDLVHELRMGDLGVDTDRDEVVRHPVENLDLEERGVRVGSRDGWRMGIRC